MLLVKSKFKKPTNRTKAAMKEAAEMLTPSEQLDLLFNKVWTEEVIIESSEEEYAEDSNLDIVDHEDALVVLRNHNEVLCGFETNEDTTNSSNKLSFGNCLHNLKSYWYIESLIIDEVILLFAEVLDLINFRS